MHVYRVTISYTIRPTQSTSSTGTLVIMRFANSTASAISAVSALFGALSNFGWSIGDNAGLRNLEVTEVTAEEVTSV